MGGLQPISRDTDDNGETNKCWLDEQKGLMRAPPIPLTRALTPKKPAKKIILC